MKVLAAFLLAIIACLNPVHGQVEPGFGKLNAGKIKHCWFYGLAEFEAEANDAKLILNDSVLWLIENKFVEVEVAGEKLTAKEVAYMKSRWFAKKFGDKGVLLIRVNPTGYCQMAVAGNQKPPEHWRFWAKMVKEYKPFAMFMNSHPKNLAAMGPEKVSNSIDEDIKRLMGKALKGKSR